MELLSKTSGVYYKICLEKQISILEDVTQRSLTNIESHERSSTDYFSQQDYPAIKGGKCIKPLLRKTRL